MGVLAQGGISAAINGLSDVANQTVDIVRTNGNISDYNFKQTIKETAIGFATSVAGSALGGIVDSKLTKNLSKSNTYFDNYLYKTFQAKTRTEAGKSSSALIRQASKALKQSDFYMNTYRGLTSVLGSTLSLFRL